MDFSHLPVLLNEAIESLNPTGNPSGTFIDGTFGRGGHSRALLKALGPEAKLLAFDKDKAAQSVAQILETEDPRFTFIPDSFANFPTHIHASVDGILLDLGVSSPQIDDPSRGFSFKQDGPLDMRMDQSQGMTAAEIIATESESSLADIFFQLGEEKFARRIAKAIVEARAIAPITRTKMLQTLIAEALPFHERHKDPATRTFQALRIYVNRELEDLDTFLKIFPDHLNAKARVSIITFHSLEDRRVKQAFTKLSQEAPSPIRGLPIPSKPPSFDFIEKKRKPTELETQTNVRARSALLRVIEKR